MIILKMSTIALVRQIRSDHGYIFTFLSFLLKLSNVSWKKLFTFFTLYFCKMTKNNSKV